MTGDFRAAVTEIGGRLWVAADPVLIAELIARVPGAVQGAALLNGAATHWACDYPTLRALVAIIGWHETRLDKYLIREYGAALAAEFNPTSR